MSDDTARGAAVRLVHRVTDGQVSMSDQIASGALDGLSPPDRARAQRLALTALRNISRADRILAPHLRKGPPPVIRAILRVAVSEILAEGAAAHGVVGQAVDLARQSGRNSEGFAAMVNAVLRRAAETPAEAWASQPATELPGWLRGRFMSAWGKKSTIAMEDAHSNGAPLDLTPRDGDAEALAERLGGVALPTGSVRLTGSAQISDLPGFVEGEWWVQDAAAALAVKVLGPQRGESILDLCAAPGGKTMQLAAAGATVTALDQSAPRMTRLEENLSRCRLQARAIVADVLTWDCPERFDAVILDAPCSATGTIRRHPDLPLIRDASGLKEIFALQAALLDRALSYVRDGGRLVFATCSLLPEEGEKQIDDVLARYPALTVDEAALAVRGTMPGWISAGRGLRLRPDYWPDVGGMDGFFISCLKKPD